MNIPRCDIEIMSAQTRSEDRDLSCGNGDVVVLLEWW